jgi:hypothetical protein
MLNSPSTTPLLASPADPLAALDAYYVEFLPAHLAKAGRAADLFRLLLLRRGNDSNAWFAAKPGVAAYLLDVGLGSALAAKQADCANAISFGLIASSVRSITKLSAPVIEALVDRDLLPLQQAISMCAAAEPEQHVAGLARLLSLISGSQRGEYLQELLATMSVPVTRKSYVGQDLGRPELPLPTADHVAVISRLAVLPDLSEAELAAIMRAAWLVGQTFAGVEACVAVAERLAGSARAEALELAWPAAKGLDLFRGRPEAQALVAVCAARGGDGQYVGGTLELALEVLDSSDERLRFNDFSRYNDDSGFGRSRLMRLQSFAEPLQVLAPALEAQQVASAVRELMARPGIPARFAVIALLPRIAELGLLGEVRGLFGQLDDIAVMAVGALLGAGVDVGIPAGQLLESAQGIEDMESRTMCVLALLPGLPLDRRLSEIEDLLRDVEDLGPRSSFRTDVIKSLSTAVRQLPGPERDDLIRRAHQPGGLTRSDREADALLDSLVNIWPADLLQERLAATRQIGLRPGDILRARRDVQPQASERPASARPEQAARPEPLLSAATASAALTFAAGMADGEKAAALVVLAPFLDAPARRQASEIADSITAAHLRLEPAVRLAALDSPPDPACLARILRLLGQVSGGLEAVQEVIDMLPSLIGPEQIPALRPVLAELAGDLPADDLIVLCPIGAVLGGPGFAGQIDETITSLGAWFGTESTPAAEKPSDNLGQPAHFALATSAVGALLVGEFARQADWAAVRSLLAVLRVAADGDDEALADAESQIIDSQATDSQATDSQATGSQATESEPSGSAAERLALLTDIMHAAPTRPRRIRALAAALRATRDEPRSALATTLLQQPDLAAPSADQLDRDLASAIVAAIDLQLRRDDLTAAASALTAFVTGAVPYKVALGRLATDAANSIARYLDAGDRPAARAGEDAVDAYLGLVAANPADYALQEAAGNLLRRRVGTAAAAAREVRPSWLSRLESLADADDPGEVILHQLALQAMCDAAGAAAAGVGDGKLAVERFGAASRRWQRHPELAACTQYFTDAAQAAVTVLQRAGNTVSAAQITDLAAVIAATTGDTRA